MRSSHYTLDLHEWIAIVIIGSLLISFCTVALISGVLIEYTINSDKFYVKEQLRDIKVTGAVQFPGHYQVDSASLIEEVIRQAKPLENADLCRISLKQEIGKKRVIHVPSASEVTITIDGAIRKSGEIKLPKGSKLEDLIGLVEFNHNADLSQLKKKRKLKEGEHIHVPEIKSL